MTMEKHNTIMIIRKMVLGGLPSVLHITSAEDALWVAEQRALISPIRIGIAIKRK